MSKRHQLSQCMIVKNEEDNIVQALTWGKGLAFEQIVVDTGSTDRTIQLARDMGARVYEYEWHNDFSAAKNYAIEKASGEWIAFLDADEYFRMEDRDNLRQMLKVMAENPAWRKVDVIRCTMLHIDDNNEMISSMKQDRIFRNRADIRYQNRIHEKLVSNTNRSLRGADFGMSLPIIHTGYSAASMEKYQKGSRNMLIIQQELKEDPDNFDNWYYLGDSLQVVNDIDGARQAYRKIVDNPQALMNMELRLGAIAALLRLSIPREDFQQSDFDYIYHRYVGTGTDHPDIEYFCGLYMYGEGRWTEAIHYFEKALSTLEKYSSSFILYIVNQVDRVYSLLAVSHIQKGNKQAAVRYYVMTLKANKYYEKALKQLMEIFLNNGEDPAVIMEFVGKLYDLHSIKDKLYILREIKTAGYASLETALYTYFTDDEREMLNSDMDRETIQKAFPSVRCKNITDYQFIEMLHKLNGMSDDEISNRWMNQLSVWKTGAQKELWDKMVQFYQDNTFWGTFDQTIQNNKVFANRLALLREHHEDLLWLYENLGDYRSKRVFLAIMKNWFELNLQMLEGVKDTSFTYFDPDIFMSDRSDRNKAAVGEAWDTAGLERQSDVLLDIGTGSGAYLKMYEDQLGSYQKVYCVEDRAEYTEILKAKAEGQGNLKLITDMNLLTDVMRSDVTFIRINVREELTSVLPLLRELITQNHPKIVLANFYSYDDIWRVPRLLQEYVGEYRFYMRYFGEDLIPTDYVLYAVAE